MISRHLIYLIINAAAIITLIVSFILYYLYSIFGLGIVEDIEPEFVNIGADSKNHHLPEPSKEKVEALITELKKFTEVKLKDNLGRLLK